MLREIKNSTDIKIFILYLLMQLDREIDYSTLNDIAVQDDFINQFDLIENLDALTNGNSIVKTERDGKEYYAITPRGRAAAGALESSLSAQIKAVSLRSALRLLDFERNGAKAESRIEDLPDGRAEFYYSVTDKRGKVMNGSLTLETRRAAEKLKLNFDDRAEFI